RLQLVNTLLVSVVAPKTCRAFELGDARVERTILVVGRAEITQTGVWFAAQPLYDCLGDTRFADAGLARDEHHSPFALLGLLRSAYEQVNLFIPADERRGGRA